MECSYIDLNLLRKSWALFPAEEQEVCVSLCMCSHVSAVSFSAIYE